jgi:glutathione synthase/RimK-type ligase-like ATP-grasp enzyme
MRKRMLYLFPDRGSAQDSEWERSEFWPVYRRAADEAEMDFDVAAPEHIMFTSDGATLRGGSLDIERDVIIHSTRANPTHRLDLWNGVSTARSLEALGFWTAIPLEAAVLLNDKYATLQVFRDSPVPAIPTVRITAGRDLARLDHEALVPDDWFPTFVKPASWGRGLGCVLCPDRQTLDGVLGMASGSDSAVVIQPSVGEVVADTRVIVVEGEVVAAYDRVPQQGSDVANVSRGAVTRLRTDLEPEILQLALLAYERLGLIYLCVDILRTADGRIWLSELEPDGAIAGLFGNRAETSRVLGARFTAYSRAHARHVAQRPVTGERLIDGAAV